ncbi:MAG: addiction module protein [Bacteroidota bacterium]
MTIDQIEAELMKLDSKSRAILAERLLQSIEELSDDEHERLWALEALKRHDELVEGREHGHPAGDVLRNVRNSLK